VAIPAVEAASEVTHMRLFPTRSAFGTAAAFLITAPAILGCGLERWPVKMVQDDHKKYFYVGKKVSSGQLVPAVTTTVAKLSKEPWPFSWKPNKFPEQWSYKLRAGTAEFTIWQITTTIIEKRNEDDGDYHLVLKSGKKKMIGEIPSEECIEDSPAPFKAMIRQARSDLDAYLDLPGNHASDMHAKVRLTGIGFFDRVHGGVGQVKKNGIELHPIIKIEFLD
jgi:hypothetical protein